MMRCSDHNIRFSEPLYLHFSAYMVVGGTEDRKPPDKAGSVGSVPGLAKLLIGNSMSLLAKSPEGLSGDFWCCFGDLSF